MNKRSMNEHCSRTHADGLINHCHSCYATKNTHKIKTFTIHQSRHFQSSLNDLKRFINGFYKKMIRTNLGGYRQYTGNAQFS